MTEKILIPIVEYDRLKAIETKGGLLATMLKLESVLRTTDEVVYFIEALKPVAPILYCGHTEEEWQQVIDGGFDVTSSERNGKFKLDEFRINHEMSESLRLPFLINEHWRADAELVREIGHRQPHFKRIGKPDLNGEARLLVTFKSSVKSDVLVFEVENWSRITEYIVLDEGGE